MDAIRDKYAADAASARASIPARFMELDAFMASMNSDPVALGKQVREVMFKHGANSAGVRVSGSMVVPQEITSLRDSLQRLRIVFELARAPHGEPLPLSRSPSIVRGHIVRSRPYLEWLWCGDYHSP